MNDKLSDKLENLRDALAGLGSVAVAYSGGVDSTLLLFVANEVLGDRAVGITVQSVFCPQAEAREAVAFCEQRGIGHVVLEADVLADAAVASNPPDRCYLCKRLIFSEIERAAAQKGCAAVVDGTNVDDMADYRPGMRALEELGVKSPLRDAGLTKADIRAASRAMGLPTWDKPSAACLASRIAYGERITCEKLERIDAAEGLLRDAGLVQCRVRVHGPSGEMARIEVAPNQIPFIARDGAREDLVAGFKRLGFSYVTLDLVGYRTGSMNEVLP